MADSEALFRHCSLVFTATSSKVAIMFLILVRREPCLEEVNCLPHVTQLGRGRAGICPGICSPSEPKLLTPGLCFSYYSKVLLSLLHVAPSYTKEIINN